RSAYRLDFVPWVSGFGASGDEPYVSYTPTSKAARVVAAALRKELDSAVSDAAHAVAPPPTVASCAAAFAFNACVNFAKFAGVLKLAKPDGRLKGNAV